MKTSTLADGTIVIEWNSNMERAPDIDALLEDPSIEKDGVSICQIDGLCQYHLPPSRQPRHRAAIHLEEQKFPKRPPRHHFDNLSIPERKGVKIVGIDYTPSLCRTVNAIQLLLGATAHRANVLDEHYHTDDNTYRFTGVVPALMFNPSTWYRAWGVRKRVGKDGKTRFDGWERKKSLEALYELANTPFYLWYKKRMEIDGERKAVHVKTLEHIVKLCEVYGGELTNQEVRDLSQPLHDIEGEQRPMLIGIQLKPIWVDGLDNYFVLKPPHYLDEIRSLARGSKYPYGYIERLLIETAKRVRRDKNLEMVSDPLTLAAELRMDAVIRKRQWSRIREVLDWCAEISKQLGYAEQITTFNKGGEQRYRIILNPGKMQGD